MRRKLATIFFLLLLTAVASSAVAATAGIEELALPSSVKVILEEAFKGNTSLHEVVIPENTTSIGSKAFFGCAALEKVTIQSQDVEIASDAFDDCPNVMLYVGEGSTGEAYAVAHGLRYAIVDESGVVYMDPMDLIGQYSIEETGLQGGDNRLIVCMNDCPLPDISKYHPVAIAPGRENVYFIQFDTSDDGDIDVNDCYAMLRSMVTSGEVAYVEPDAVTYVTNRGEDTDIAMQAGIMTWDEDDDPMGFDEYSHYVAEHQSGSQVIAVVDTGIRRSPAYDSMLYSQNFNVIPDGQDAFYSGRNHGSFIASIIHDCVGDTNVKIMSVRAVDDNEETLPSIFGMGIEKAVEAGADIINISYILPASRYVEDELQSAAEKGVKIIIAAGNYNGSTADYFPANANIGENKIVVSGLESADRIWSRTNTGPQVSFCAPAAGIQTSYANIGEGTSFAAPMIASAYALVELDTIHEISDMIQTCKTDIGLNGKPNLSQAIGHGMPQLDQLAAQAVTAITVENAPSIMKVGGTATLNYSVLPVNATNQTISCTSSDDSILQVEVAGNGDWGEWGEWGNTQRPITDSEHMQEEMLEQHIWFRYVCKDCGACMPVANVPCDVEAGGCGSTESLTSSPRQTNILPVSPEDGVQNWRGTDYIVYGDDAKDRWFYFDKIESYRYRYMAAGKNELVLNAVRKGKASITLSANDDSGVTCKLDVQVVQPVTSINISADSTELKTNKTLALSVNVQPSSADNRNVTWSSSNTSIATVSQTGVVTPVSAGNVVIRADAQDGFGASGQISIEVIEIPDPESITVAAQNKTLGSNDTLELAPGDKLQLTASVSPKDAVQTVLWSAKSIPATANVVTIDSATGYLTAVNAGSAVVTVTSTEKGTVSQQISILVQVKSTGITISGAGEVKVGATISLTATVMPANATNKEVSWSSNNTSIATVTQNGVVTGVKNGEVDIVATSKADSKISQKKHIVVKQMPKSISISGTVNLLINNDNPNSPAQNSSQLTANFTPADTYSKAVTWTSSNTGVATVSSTGQVKTVKPGTTTITAKSNLDSNVKASVTVTVKNKWSDWTSWSDTTASATSTKQVKTRTLYRSTTTTYGSWGKWSNYDLTKRTSSDTMDVESKSVWEWGYFTCPYCGFHIWAFACNCFNWGDGVTGCGKYIKSANYTKLYLPYDHQSGQWNFHGVGTNRVRIYDSTYGYGWIYGAGDHSAKTGYRYRTRTSNVSTSGWQEDSIQEVNTSTKKVKVEKKTQYSYRTMNSF